ncbi:MAG: hypothetical protein AAB309_07750 [Deltaproteobacteria bacterium]
MRRYFFPHFFVIFLSFLFIQSFESVSKASHPFVCRAERGIVEHLEVTEGNVHIITPPLPNLSLQGASILVRIAEEGIANYIKIGSGNFHYSVSAFDKTIQLQDKNGVILEEDVATFDFDKDKREVIIHVTNLLARYSDKYLVIVHFTTAGWGENGAIINGIQIKCGNHDLSSE